MKVEFIEPFISATFAVLEMVVGTRPERGQISLRNYTFTSRQVSILAGVNGQVEGQALYAMSNVTAMKIATKMIGTPVEQLDEMALSALAELGNMVTGNAITLLSQNGYTVDITPPSIVRGLEVEVSTKTPALVVPVMTEFGKIDINVALVETAATSRAAA
jgi:chemotaxis protein CheX